MEKLLAFDWVNFEQLSSTDLTAFNCVSVRLHRTTERCERCSSVVAVVLTISHRLILNYLRLIFAVYTNLYFHLSVLTFVISPTISFVSSLLSLRYRLAVTKRFSTSVPE